MRFRSNIGTQPNAANLRQIAPGSGKIPQSFLNGIGRAIDKATPRFGGMSPFFRQTAGGVVFELPDASASQNSQQYLHPFKVTYAGQVNGGYLVNILEGRICGRADHEYAQLINYPSNGEPINVPSIGTPGFDSAYAGGWPTNQSPDLGDTTGSESSPGSQVNSTDGNSGSTNHTPSNTGKPYVSGSAGSLSGAYVSGNAGSITNPGNGGTYHSPLPVSGNGNYVSGNAGSLNPGFGGGTYHSPLPINGNQTFRGTGSGSTQTTTLTPLQGQTNTLPAPTFHLD